MPNLPLTENPKSDRPLQVDLALVARDLRISPENVEKTVQLLDDGNTIPFITRFRKDLTGGLNEKQVQSVKQLVAQYRALGERKSFVLKSIESQGKLTDGLKLEIHNASSGRRLEDLYLPFKPQKQSRAATAKQQGLEPLADDIFNASTTDVDLASRATDFVRVDKGLNSVDDVIRGVGDLLVERFGENGELKSTLRQILWNTGKLAAQSVVDPESEPKATTQKALLPKKDVGVVAAVAPEVPESVVLTLESSVKSVSSIESASLETSSTIVAMMPEVPTSDDLTSAPGDAQMDGLETSIVGASSSEIVGANSPDACAVAENSAAEATAGPLVVAMEAATPPGSTGESAVVSTKKKKNKNKKTTVDPFKDYHDFRQPLKNLPDHRVLAVNRGERAGKLKVRIQADDSQLTSAAYAALVPENHPFAEFLKKCASDAVGKVLLPSLEREARRELTEAAEKHAVEVFANNLRNLLLQPPIRNQRVLAIDPGFKSGCAVAILDGFGNLLDSGQVYVVGNQSRRDESKLKIVEWVKKYSIDIIAVGTGAACRQAEQLVSDSISEQLADHNVRYVMVNEAGASIYSTSEIGREELPDLTPSIRSAVSIGRRLQDPLSELVKISPANIGVGMYQHDVKAKHLSESLDEVVEVCVNQVGVNVNTASPSLLKYVSGLNALTARRLVEHRQQIKGFKNRQQLKEVSGIGEATFVQAAGFLRIRGGDNPFDSTSIHPESYYIAENIVARVKSTPEELFPYDPDPILLPPLATPVVAPVVEVQPLASAPPTTEVLDLGQPTTAEPITAEPIAVEPIAVEPITAEPIAVAPITVSPTPAAAALSPSTRERLTDEQAALHAEARKEVIDQITRLEIDQIAEENSAGKLLVRDILMALRKPDWDPRDRVHKPIFRRGIIKVDDLKPEMQLDGQIVNVVDFGVFIDIGLGESSLVHVSQLSNQYISDPHRFCSVGDVLKVWVSEIDTARRRVKLTAIQPGTKSERPARRSKSSNPAKSPTNPARPSTFSGPTSRQATTPGESRTGSNESRVKRFERSKSAQRYEGGKTTDNRQAHRGNPNDRPRPHRPAQPAPPITEGMLKGKEPMRSFSDLIQFVKGQPEKDDKKSS